MFRFLHDAIKGDEVDETLRLLKGWDGRSRVRHGKDPSFHPLVLAVECGANKVLSALLSLPNVDVDVVNQDVGGNNALQTACFHSSFTAVRLLLQAGANPNFLVPSECDLDLSNLPVNRLPPLFLSVFWNCNLSIVELLLQNGADPNFVLPSQDPLLFRALNLKDNGCSLIPLLVKYGADLHTKAPFGAPHGQTLLFRALSTMRVDVLDCVLSVGATMNPQDPEIRRVISNMLSNQRQEIYWQLLQTFLRHVKVDACGVDGLTVLHWTIRKKFAVQGNVDAPCDRLLAMLMEQDANIVNQPERFEPFETPLDMACQARNATWVHALLEAGATVDARAWTCLVVESPNPNEEKVRHIWDMLCSYSQSTTSGGCDVGTPFPCTLWHAVAARFDCSLWLPILWRSSVPSQLPVVLLQTDADGQTVWHVASRHCNFVALTILMAYDDCRAKSSLETRNAQGDTVLHQACRHSLRSSSLLQYLSWGDEGETTPGLEQATTVEILLQAGSDPLALDAQGNYAWFYDTLCLDARFRLVRQAALAGIFG